MQSENIYLLVVSAVLAYISNYYLKYITPKSKLVFWKSHFSPFEVPTPNNFPASIPPIISILTKSITIQNVGARPSSKIEIAFHCKDQFQYRLFPSLESNFVSNILGEHIITIDRLAEKEVFSVHTLSLLSEPHLLYIRNESGQATEVVTYPQQTRSRFYTFTVQAIIIIGLITASYWFLRLILFLWAHI